MPLADSPQTAISVDDAFLSVELWAASKIVGRECSQVNLDYFKCKESKVGNSQRCFAEVLIFYQILRQADISIVAYDLMYSIQGDDPKACKHEASYVRKCPAEM
jgi:hypothetical protein